MYPITVPAGWSPRDRTNPAHVVEDMLAALDVALRLHPALADTSGRARVQAALTADPYPRDALILIGQIFGARVLGVVMLFSIDACTAIQGDVEVLSRPQTLKVSTGLDLVDLHWPIEVLHPVHSQHGTIWSEHDRELYQRAMSEYWAARMPATPPAPEADPAAQIGAVFCLATQSKLKPALRRAEAQARLALAAAIIGFDQKLEACGDDLRQTLHEQAAIEEAKTAYAQALADLVRGEA